MSNGSPSGTRLVLLVGPKGAGKSTLGRALERHAGVVFFEVERHWLEYRSRCVAAGLAPEQAGGQRQVLEALADTLQRHGIVSAETTGADAAVLEGYLRAAPSVFIVRLQAPLPVCEARIASRNARAHLPASAELVSRVHRLSEDLVLEADLRLDSTLMSPEAAALLVVDALRAQLQRPGGSGTNC